MSLLLLLTNPAQVVQTTFLEPGGDADFAVTTTNGFWGSVVNGPSVVSDFVHGTHQRSLKHALNTSSYVLTPSGILFDTGSRFSFYLYLNALPTTTTDFVAIADSAGLTVAQVKVTSAGVLQMYQTGSTQIGSNGSTLSTGVWYRISLAFRTTSTTVNRFELFKNGVSDISITNATLSRVGSSRIYWGTIVADATADYRFSDFYADNSISLTDTGNIWVTAKRPNANGTTNGFTTQIGVGGSGYGTGHSPQVNERALSTTNGWSMIGAGAAITEQYNIEGQATGDTNISTGTIVDYMGWVSAMALVAAGANIIVNGVSTAISLITSAKVFTKVAGSTSYLAGTGADIGITTDTTLTTVSLYEAGVIVAYIPGAAGGNNNQRFMLMGAG